MKTKTLVQTAIFTALVVVLGFFVKVPTFNGFVTLADAGIFTGAMLFGKKRGAFIGGVSCFLIDVIVGYPQWCLISLVIHGLQGYLVGYFGYEKSKLSQVIGFSIGSFVMVTGYFIAEGFMYGFGAGFVALAGNISQEIVGAMVAIILVAALKKSVLGNGVQKV